MLLLRAVGETFETQKPVSKGHLMQWVILIAVIVVLLTIDLLLHRGNHEPTAKRALVESGVWVGCGLAFSAVVLLVVWAARPSASTSAAT